MATYYIATSGTDGAGVDGSYATPWKTLSYACTRVTTPGDVIYVEAGTYTETAQSVLSVGVSIIGAGDTSIITTSAALNPLLLLSSASEGTDGNQSISYVKFNGDDTGVVGVQVRARSNVTIRNCSFIDFTDNGLRFTGKVSGGGAPTDYAENNVVTNCTFTNCGSETFYDPYYFASGAIGISGQKDILISGNYIYNNQGNYAYGINTNGQGYNMGLQILNNHIYVSPKHLSTNQWSFAIELWNCRGGIVISGNYLTGAVDLGGESTDDTGEYGFACQITDNTIEMSALQPYDHTGVYLESDVSGGAEITRNYIKNFNNGVLLNTLSGPLDHQEDILIAYNIIVETLKTTGDYSGRAIGHGTATSGSTYEDIRIFNNIIYNSTYVASAGVHFASSGVTYTDLQIRNNIFVKAYNSIRFENNTVTGVDITNNLFYLHTNYYTTVSATITDLVNENNIISENPLFTVDGSDFHLQAGSPCINAGIDVGLTTDYDDVPVGSPYPAIGAFEYAPPEPDPVPIVPPTYNPIKVGTIRVNISKCIEGIYLRWWFNGWHYFNFTNGYEINMTTESMDTQVSQFFSVISKIERDTRIKSEYDYKVTLHGITSDNIAGFTGLLMAEKAEQYEDGVWREVDITRGEHIIKEEGTNGYILDFEITRKELPGASSVYQKTLRLYIGDILCDIDDSEVVPQNKQVNNIAEMQDRQSDFTAEFRIRKTRAMRALFELSGEVGATTTFPYEQQPCRLVQDNIEITTQGILMLDKVDDQYYYVSIVSGNISFFKAIEDLMISDLTLASMNHTWDVATMAATHSITSPPEDYVYPLCEPSDDGGIAPLTDDGDRVEMYGGWIWCFCKVKAIWDEIIANSGFTVTGGDVFDSDLFNKLYIPIKSREITDTKQYLYSMYWSGWLAGAANIHIGNTMFPGSVLIKGSAYFLLGGYTYPYNGNYKIKFIAYCGTLLSAPISVYVYSGGGLNGYMNPVANDIWSGQVFEYEITGAMAAQVLTLVVPEARTWYYWSWTITNIEGAEIAYGSTVEPRAHLPKITQTEFVKMVCHLFGLVPDVMARDRKVRFWNYQELYENIPQARDWSNYLSERDDDTEFKFGDYARNNYLKYKESSDVLLDNGIGNLPIDDQTLPESKDIVQLILSTCDEVKILINNFAVNVSRINFNKYNASTDLYEANKTIDARLVYIDRTRAVASPPYEKVFGVRATVGAGAATDINSPLKASSIEVAFSSLIPYYAYISRLLTKTNMRRAKFNLPVYEVAGIRHNIPIYLRQYKAYFYVNKISNYVPGKLCTIELIRL